VRSLRFDEIPGDKKFGNRRDSGPLDATRSGADSGERTHSARSARAAPLRGEVAARPNNPSLSASESSVRNQSVPLPSGRDTKPRNVGASCFLVIVKLTERAVIRSRFDEFAQKSLIGLFGE